MCRHFGSLRATHSLSATLRRVRVSGYLLSVVRCRPWSAELLIPMPAAGILSLIWLNGIWVWRVAHRASFRLREAGKKGALAWK